MHLVEAAVAVLQEGDPWAKARLSRHYAAAWFAGELCQNRRVDDRLPQPPKMPARPERPLLLEPRHMPKRRPGTVAGRAALLHAIAHIELNAIDLHWDVLARFWSTPMPQGFYEDWVRAADEESKHFLLVSDRLTAHDIRYGDLPAHDGLWRSAVATAHDLRARLAVVPMVLEARGLDVTPGMINLFKNIQDTESVTVLETIYAEEVGHVAYGSKWFHFLCGRFGEDPKTVWQEMVRKYFTSSLKPPFNDEKRAEAGLPLDFYWPLVDENS